MLHCGDRVAVQQNSEQMGGVGSPRRGDLQSPGGGSHLSLCRVTVAVGWSDSFNLTWCCWCSRFSCLIHCVLEPEEPTFIGFHSLLITMRFNTNVWNFEGLQSTGMCEVTPTRCHISFSEMEKARQQWWCLRECGNLGPDFWIDGCSNCLWLIISLLKGGRCPQMAKGVNRNPLWCCTLIAWLQRVQRATTHKPDCCCQTSELDRPERFLFQAVGELKTGRWV